MKVPFSPPRMDQKIIEEVTAALKSGWITTGPRVKLFEEKLTAYGGQKNTLCVSSGSAGLELILRWFGVGPGDEVIVPAYTYAATANTVVHCGAKVVFVDVKDDFNIDVDAVANAITEHTKVIMPVDLAGFPCDYDELNELTRRHKKSFTPVTDIQKKLGRILVLSDAAHSVGAVYKRKKTGNLTDVSVYSFHAVKNLTTAEGGAICLNLPEPFDNEEVYRYLRIKSLHGQTKDAFSKAQLGAWKYDIIEPGYKFNMTDIAAAMGLVELERYEDDMLQRRKHIFDEYADGFSGFDWARIPQYETKEKISSYHVFLLRIKGITETERDAIIQKIAEKEVAVNVHFIPLPMMTFYRGLGYRMEDYPVSYQNYSEVISLPVYYTLSDENVESVIHAVATSVKDITGKD